VTWLKPRDRLLRRELRNHYVGDYCLPMKALTKWDANQGSDAGEDQMTPFLESYAATSGIGEGERKKRRQGM